MQAIQTKYFGPTNTRGSRIKASAAAGSRTFPYNHAWNLEKNHYVAAEQLVKDCGWDQDGYGHLVSGCLADGSFVHVLTGRDGKGG